MIPVAALATTAIVLLGVAVIGIFAAVAMDLWMRTDWRRHQQRLHAKLAGYPDWVMDSAMTPTGHRPQKDASPMFRQMEPGTKKSMLHGKPLYKVVVDGRSVNGGRFDYTPYLPTEKGDGTWTPGAWTPEIAIPEACVCGYHLTTDPFGAWRALGMTVYAAEGHGAYAAADGGTITTVTDNKLAFASIRLLAPVDMRLTEAKMVIAGVGNIPFLNPTGYVPPAVGAHKVFDTYLQASAAFADAGGGRGYPAVSTKDLDLGHLVALSDAAAALVDTLPPDKVYAANAFPTTLAYCLAKYALAGKLVPAELTQRLRAYHAGFGVAGRTDDGTLFLFRAY